MSPGVAHQYCGALGKTANCQVLVSVNAATDRASCPLGWRLFLPKSWDQDEDRRARARIPEDVRHVPKWQLALGIIDELLGWGLERRVVQADGGYGDITAFRIGLEERDLQYVVQVKGVTSAQPADATPIVPEYQGRGRPRTARYPDKPLSLRELVLAAGREQVRTVGWREGDRGPLASQFIAIRVRPANDEQRQDDGVLPERWLLAEWPKQQGRAGQVLALQPSRRHATRDAREPREAPLAGRARLPRTQAMPRPRSLRRPHISRTASPPHLRHRRARVPDLLPPAPRPRPPSAGGSLISLYQAQRDLQTALACWHGHCPTCQRRLPP